MAKYLIGNIKGPKGDRGEAGPTYTAGNGIDITNNVISATNSGGITTETDPVFSASPAAGITTQDITDWNAKSDFSGSYNDLTDKPDLSVYATTTALGTGLARKQDTLTAGTNITIDSNNVISAAAAEDELPTIASGDAGKVLAVNSGETGVEWTTVSGGSTYTAGKGIEIDANNEISREAIDFGEPLFSLFFSGLTSQWMLGGKGSYTNKSSVNDLADALKTYKIAETSTAFGLTSFSPADLNTAMGTNYMVYKFITDYNSSTPVSCNYYPADSTSNINAGGRKSMGLIIVNDMIYCTDGGISTLKRLFGYDFLQNLTVSTYNHPNFGTNSRLRSVLNSLDTAISNKQDALPALTDNAGKVLTVNSGATGLEWVEQSAGGSSLPADPAADGTYFLSTTVSSGTATQSWVSIPAANGNNF